MTAMDRLSLEFFGISNEKEQQLSGIDLISLKSSVPVFNDAA
jgi:hypothetical protein